MKKFLRWGQVQQQLKEHLAEHGVPCSFYQAVQDLWKLGTYETAEELPLVSFAEWDTDDLDGLEALLDATPVDLSGFVPSFQAKVPARTAVRHALSLKSAPIRIGVDQAMGLHKNNVFRILCVLRGQGRMITPQGERSIPENTVCIIAPNSEHDAVAEEGCLMLSIALSDQMVEQTMRKVLEHDRILFEFFRNGLSGGGHGYLLLRPESPRQIRRVCGGILHESYTRGPYSKNIFNSYLEILFSLMMRSRDLTVDFRREPPGDLSMIQVLKYIQDHFRETSLGEVAELFHYDPSYLSRQIKGATGRNYTDLLRELRLNEAKYLLSHTDLSMDEVAARSGFDNRAHFFRTFRAEAGMTPGDWRKKEKN